MPPPPSLPAVLPRGVVFDCDGTLADTEALSYRAWGETLAERGYAITPRDFTAVVGRPFPSTWAYYADRVELGDQTRFREELRARYLAAFATELEIHDDAITTMRALASGGVPIAVASSSLRSSVERVLDHAGVGELVTAIVGADDVARHKPDPEPYRTAARLLGVEPGACSAVEDTEVGVASAVAAGMFTVGVLRAHNDAHQLAAADRVVEAISVSSLVGTVRAS